MIKVSSIYKWRVKNEGDDRESIPFMEEIRFIERKGIRTIHLQCNLELCKRQRNSWVFYSLHTIKFVFYWILFFFFTLNCSKCRLNFFFFVERNFESFILLLTCYFKLWDWYEWWVRQLVWENIKENDCRKGGRCVYESDKQTSMYE